MQPDQMAEAGVNWIGLAGLAALIAGFGLLFLYLVILPARREAAALQALASRRGWIVRRDYGGGGKPTRISVTPGSSGSWQAEIVRYQKGNAQAFSTEYRAPQPRTVAGAIVVGPGLPPAEAALAGQMLGMMQGRLEQLLLTALTDAALAPHLAGLAPAPGPGLPGATVMVSGGADPAQVLAGFAPHLAEWRGEEPAEEAFPILIVTPEGTRLRLRQDAGAARLEALIDMGRALAEAPAG